MYIKNTSNTHDYQNLSKILGFSLGVAITGSEKIGPSIMITEGFGNVEMSDKTYDILRSHAGKNASINGATQIRAGVIRPEVIIPIIEQSDISQDFNEDDLVIKEGSKVRIIREPYFGKIGIVKNLPSKPVEIDSETKARVAEIEFDNSEDAFYPDRKTLDL